MEESVDFAKKKLEKLENEGWEKSDVINRLIFHAEDRRELETQTSHNRGHKSRILNLESWILNI